MIVGCFDIYKYSTFVWYAWHCVKESSEKVVFPTGDPSGNCRVPGSVHSSFAFRASGTAPQTRVKRERSLSPARPIAVTVTSSFHFFFVSLILFVQVNI